ncbi:MAG: hypothetical protein FWE45_03670 [Firmicutes bacterium]|nr:hypothetical protein [Bacillota bacterium]
MEKKIIERKMFMGGNTSQGFVGFYDQIVDMYDLRKMYILKGSSGSGKSTFIKNFVNSIMKTDTLNSHKVITINWIYCSQDPNSYDGVIIKELGLGIIDGTFPHIVDPKYPGIIEEFIDLTQFIDVNKIRDKEQRVKEISKKKKEHFKQAYKYLQLAKQEHDKIEAIYTPCIDFKKIDKLLVKLIADLSISEK